MRPRRQRARQRSQLVAQREVVRVEGHAAGFDFREIEDVVDHHQQPLGRRRDRAQAVALVVVAAGVQRYRRHAQNPVHGGADLVAHVRQELALQLGDLFGPLFCRLQVAVQPQQLVVVRFDLIEHSVEGRDQRADLALLAQPGAHREVAVRRDLPRGFRQFHDRRRDQCLQARGQQERRPHQDREHEQHRDGVAQDFVPHRSAGESDLDLADPLSLKEDRLAQPLIAVAGGGPAEAGETPAVRIEQDGGRDVADGRQRGQGVAGRFVIIEGQCGGRVSPYQFGAGRQSLRQFQPGAVGFQTHQQQRRHQQHHARGQRHDQLQLAFEREAHPVEPAFWREVHGISAPPSWPGSATGR